MSKEIMVMAVMQAFQAWADTVEMDVFIVWRPDLSGWIGNENLGTPLEFNTPQEALAWLLGVQHG